MSRNEKVQCALLLALIAVPLSIPSLQVTSFGGWPAMGFAAALFLVAGPERRWWVAGAQFVVMSVALSSSYDVPLPLGGLGAMTVILPAFFTAHFLARHGGGLRLDEVDNKRYHTVTAASGLLLGVAACALVGWRWTRATPSSRA